MSKHDAIAIAIMCSIVKYTHDWIEITSFEKGKETVLVAVGSHSLNSTLSTKEENIIQPRIINTVDWAYLQRCSLLC